MIRLTTKLFKFSTEFYHPCSFKLNSDAQEESACLLASYFNYYRSHGHHYAKLDPLGIYNKYSHDYHRNY